MRLTIEFSSNQLIYLPISYNEIIQGFIYANITSEELKNFIHDKGYEYNNKKFKLFTFSRLDGDYSIDLKNKIIIFHNKVTLKISSILPEFIKDIMNTLLMKSHARFGKQKVLVNSVFIESDEIEEKMTVKTLSPIVVYSTISSEKRKFTYYYHPKEQDFKNLIKKNLIDKYRARYKENINGDFNLKLIKMLSNKEEIVYYKNFLIKGYNGVFEISGDYNLLKIAYDSGLGAKNAQGFGMIEKVNKGERENL